MASARRSSSPQSELPQLLYDMRRTKAALAAAKARGVVLAAGVVVLLLPMPTEAKAVLAHSERAARRAADLAPVLEQLLVEDAGSLGALSSVLNSGGIPGTGGGRWTATTVRDVGVPLARPPRRSPGAAPWGILLSY
jgi:hypothetical protein